MEPISEGEKWFFPDDAFFPARLTGEDKKPEAVSHAAPTHYPQVPRADWHPCRCDVCGARNVTRRCLVCDPVPEEPLDLIDEEPDAIAPEDEPAMDARIAAETAKIRQKRQKEGNAMKKQKRI